MCIYVYDTHILQNYADSWNASQRLYKYQQYICECALANLCKMKLLVWCIFSSATIALAVARHGGY